MVIHMSKYLCILLSLIAFHTYANCQPQINAPYSMQVDIGSVTSSANDPVGAVLSSQTKAVDWNASADYYMYCASGQAQILYEVTNTSVSGYSDQIFETGIQGIGVRFKFSSAEINQFTVYGLGNWQQISPMTFYFDPGKYIIEVVKTAAQTGAGQITSKIHIRQSTDRGNTLGTLDLVAGDVVSSGCTLMTPSVTVPLLSHPTNEFKGIGSVTSNQPVPLLLNCPSAGTLINMTVSATAEIANSGVIKLDGSSTANGIGVQLLNTDGATPVPINSSTPTQIGVSTIGDNNISLYARYYQTEATVSSGSADATATLTLNYQ